MKTTKKNFEIFKEECEKWVKIFGLNYRTHYSWDAKEGTYAECRVRLSGQNVTFWFTRDWNDEIRPLTDEDVREVAKHEAIHALLGRFSENTIS